MNVIILAAGYGTRLYPLTKDVPKPLIEINNKPIINFLIEKIGNLKKQYPVGEIKIVSNNKFHEIFLRWREKYNLDIDVLNDGTNSPEERLGAIKDIKFAIKDKDKDWLVLGGDNLFEDNLEGFMEFVRKKKDSPCVGIHDVKDKNKASRFGVVLMGEDDRILKLEEKPKDPPSTLTAACMYFFPAGSLQFLDNFIEETDSHDASGKYIEWLVNKTDVFGYLLKGKWLDIGHSDSLKSAEQLF